MLKFFFTFIGVIATLIVISQGKNEEAVAKIRSQFKDERSDSSKVEMLIELCNAFVSRAGEDKKDLDSAMFFLKQAEAKSNIDKNEGWLARCYLSYSKLLRERKAVVKAKKYIQTAIDMFTRLNWKADLADAYVEAGAYDNIYNTAELNERVEFLKMATVLFEQVGNKDKQALELKNLGDLYYTTGDDLKAVKVLERSLAIYLSIQHQELQGIYDLLGTVYADMTDYTRGIKYGLLAVKTAEKMKDSSIQVCTIYNRLGISFYCFKDFNQAGFYMQKSLDIAVRQHDTASIIQLNINLSNVAESLNKPKEALAVLIYLEKNYPLKENERQVVMQDKINAYVKDNQPNMASPLVNDLLKVTVWKGIEGGYYRMMIKYYLAIKVYRKVYAYCDLYERNNTKNGRQNGSEDVYKWRFKADSALGRYISAIRNFQSYKSVSDSLYSDRKRQEIASLNVEFETFNKDRDLQSKEQDIQLLNKQKQLQIAETNKAVFMRNVIVAGTIMLILLLGLLYNRYTIKQKQYKKEQAGNEQLLLKQEEINKKNIALQHLVEEKEWLVKEIHHRVKNNLQVVMSLLNTQSAYSDNEQSYAAILESRQRMYAMSLIHQKLYQTANMTLVNMETYVPELVSFLKDSFSGRGSIRFDLHVAHIDLDVAQAMPVGLILNEAITNAMKYAFGDHQTGTIMISMSLTSDGLCTLIVRDNGKGLSQDFNLHKKGSMGITLMEALAEQLTGKIDFADKEGLIVTVTFQQLLIEHRLRDNIS